MGKPEPQQILTDPDRLTAVPTGCTELPGNQREGWSIDVMHERCCQELVEDISRDMFEPEVSRGLSWLDITGRQDWLSSAVSMCHPRMDCITMLRLNPSLGFAQGGPCSHTTHKLPSGELT